MQRIETERLILRSFTEQDTDDLYRYAVDPDVGPRAGWKPHESREETLLIIRSFIEEGSATGPFYGRLLDFLLFCLPLLLFVARTTGNRFSRSCRCGAWS